MRGSEDIGSSAKRAARRRGKTGMTSRGEFSVSLSAFVTFHGGPGERGENPSGAPLRAVFLGTERNERATRPVL